MVLQRDEPVPISGRGVPGHAVTVRFAGQVKKTVVGNEGRWAVTLDPVSSRSESGSLKINHVVLNDILVGDVWLCSGQSNMEWTIRRSLNPQEEAEQADYDRIRHFNIPRLFKPELQNDAAGEWKVCSSDTVMDFTAVGYFFARRLHRELEIPIGLINSTWGGTRIEPWIPAEAFASHPRLRHLAGEARNPKPINREAKRAHQKPSLLYNAMIHPLVDFPIKGAIWYQGESNGGGEEEALAYLPKMQALVSGWRQAWNVGAFPFYFCQLANFKERIDDPAGGNGYALIREAQRRSLAIPHTGMATLIDIGEAEDIHPKNKQDVGHRLAQWALARTYGKDLVPSGPLFERMEVSGNRVRIFFRHVGSGLMAGEKAVHQPYLPVEEVEGGVIHEVALAGKNGVWSWADARIEGKSVVAIAQEVDQPVAVRYAYQMNPAKANLYNKEGLPASPFTAELDDIR